MLKKVWGFLAAIVLVLLLPAALSAQGMMDGGYMGGGMMGNCYNNSSGSLEKSESVQVVLTKIRAEQDLKDTEAINPEKVSPKLLGELGDAVMDVMIGNKQAHERMDSMMGGDGSVMLENMHEQMGYRYLQGLPIGMMGWGYGPGSKKSAYYGEMGGCGPMMGYYGGFYGSSPYMPMMSFGSSMGMGTLMDINWILDYRYADYVGLTKDQIKKITDLKLAYEKETDPARLKLLEKRRQLFDLWSAAKPDIKAIKDTDREILNLLSSISDKETEYRISILELMTAEQRSKMDYKGMLNYGNEYLNK